MSVNKVILIGNVGRDPEVRYLDSGIAVASLPLATTDRAYTLANGTQVPERTEWHNLVLWRGLAETAEKYVHKGDKLYVEGKIRTRSYDDQTGAKRYVTEIHADRIEFYNTGSKPADGASSNSGTGFQQGGQPQATSYQQPVSQQPDISSDSNSADDLPF